MSKIEDVNLLLEVAEQYGESPIDFYDGIHIVKKNKGETPMMTKSRMDNLEYDNSIDPYKNACDYYRACFNKQCIDVAKISLLDRDFILDQLAKKSTDKEFTFNEGLKDPFQLIIRETYNTSVQFKRVYIDLDYFMFKENTMKSSVNKDDLIRISKKVFKSMIEKTWLESIKKDIVEYINIEINDVKNMGRKTHKKCMVIRIKMDHFSKVESLFADEFPSLSTEQILRGLYFFAYDGVVSYMENCQ